MAKSLGLFSFFLQKILGIADNEDMAFMPAVDTDSALCMREWVNLLESIPELNALPQFYAHDHFNTVRIILADNELWIMPKPIWEMVVNSEAMIDL